MMEMDASVRGVHVFISMLILVCFYGLETLQSPRIGNHRKLGEQRNATVETDEVYTVPQPLEFYEKFVKENKPVVFRGVAKNSRAFKMWTEDFLINRYGNLTVRLEAKSEQSVQLPLGAISLGLDLLGNFLKGYQTLDAYVISQIPEPIERDILIPPCLRCGSFKSSIQEAHLFLSASGGKTALHKDPYNNIHCVFNGTKDWILIDPSQTESVYMSKDSEYEWGGLSVIDVDDVDLDAYPKIADVKFSKLQLAKGDCIFMPSGYWHQVRSFGYMNSAIAIWFSTLDSFDEAGCDEKIFDFVPMNTVPVIWRYSGFGNLTQGHMDIFVLKKTLMLWSDENGRIDLNSFVNRFFVLLEKNQDNEAMKTDIEKRKKQFVRYFGTEDEGYTSKRFIEKLTIDQLKDLVEIIHPNDISNTDVLEYGHIPVDIIAKIIMESLYENGTFDAVRFLQHYTKELGGTKSKGEEVISRLEIPQNSLVTPHHLLARLDFALEKYASALVHDSATEKQMFNFLKLRNGGHDEL